MPPLTAMVRPHVLRQDVFQGVALQGVESYTTQTPRLVLIPSSSIQTWATNSTPQRLRHSPEVQTVRCCSCRTCVEETSPHATPPAPFRVTAQHPTNLRPVHIRPWTSAPARYPSPQRCCRSYPGCYPSLD